MVAVTALQAHLVLRVKAQKINSLENVILKARQIYVF